jgi:hypothetical protein
VKKHIKARLKNLIQGISLHQEDEENALSLLKYNELGEAFQIMCEQAYEYEIPITKEAYTEARQLAQEMQIPSDQWSFIEELIEDKSE